MNVNSWRDKQLATRLMSMYNWPVSREWFEPARAVLGRIAQTAFARIEGFVGAHLATICDDPADHFGWRARAAELDLETRNVLRAVAMPSLSWRDVFTPYQGHWVGGDLHRSDRMYQHIWYPAVAEDPTLMAQRVLMIAVQTQQVTVAYDFCEGPTTPRISGVVGNRVHRGYAIGDGPLLWIAAEPNGEFSLHLERVWAEGQLYDVRGVIVGINQGQPVLRGYSDWRYHRLPDGTVPVPQR